MRLEGYSHLTGKISLGGRTNTTVFVRSGVKVREEQHDQSVAELLAALRPLGGTGVSVSGVEGSQTASIYSCELMPWHFISSFQLWNKRILVPS